MQPQIEPGANEADAQTKASMKKILSLAILSALAFTANAAEYSVFRVCEDQHVIRTSDGAEAGRVEYIVVEPSSHRVISTVITGGVIGERLVALPVESMQFSERQITLTQIDRTRLVAAPVIEKTQLSTTVVQPALIERSYTHFGASLQGGVSTSTRTSTDVNVNTREGREARSPRGTTTERGTTSSATTRTDSDNPARTAEQPGRTTTGAATSTDASRQGRTSTRPGEQPEPVAERTRGRDDARESKMPTATPNPRDNSGRTPSTPPADTSRQRSESEKPAGEKSTSEKPGGSSEAQQPERKGERSGSAAERSSEKAERSSQRENAAERRSEKSAGNADQTSKAGSETPGTAREKKQQE